MNTPLYHGTAFKNLNTILKVGIVPRQDQKKREFESSVPLEFVYLTDMYPMFFGMASCNTDENENIAIVEVDPSEINEDNFYPDDDFIWWIQKTHKQLDDKIPIDVQLKLAGDLVKYNQKLWKPSLEKLGTIAHLGAVIPKHIKRIAVINFKEMDSSARLTFFSFADVSITPTIIAYRKPKMQNEIAWIFGDTDDLMFVQNYPDEETQKAIEKHQQLLNVVRDKCVTVTSY